MRGHLRGWRYRFTLGKDEGNRRVVSRDTLSASEIELALREGSDYPDFTTWLSRRETRLMDTWRFCTNYVYEVDASSQLSRLRRVMIYRANGVSFRLSYCP